MKHRYTILLIFFLSIHVAGFAQEDFSIEGKVKNISSDYIYLNYPSAWGIMRKDSALIDADGKFSFKGKIDHPVAAMLTTHNKPVSVEDPNFTTIFISLSEMKLDIEKDHFKEAILKGSPDHDIFDKMQKVRRDIEKKMQPVLQEYKKEQNDAKRDSIYQNKVMPYYREMADKEYEFLVNNPSTYVTAYYMMFYINELTLDKLEQHYAWFSDNIKKSSYGVRLKSEIDDIKAGSPGAVARDFSAAGIDGATVMLSSFKQKKYVLLDFWASWCKPCRAGNPHLRDIYAKYKQKGFEIIGISDDDRDPNKWKKAVNDDQLPWVHVLRGMDMQKLLKRERNDADISQKYGVHELPTKILIDKNGVIIGRYNEEEDDKMDAKLKEIFGN